MRVRGVGMRVCMGVASAVVAAGTGGGMSGSIRGTRTSKALSYTTLIIGRRVSRNVVRLRRPTPRAATYILRDSEIGSARSTSPICVPIQASRVGARITACEILATAWISPPEIGSRMYTSMSPGSNLGTIPYLSSTSICAGLCTLEGLSAESLAWGVVTGPLCAHL